MLNSTTNTYTLKREILTFSKKISRNLPKPERKFVADMNYGMLASGSCMLTDIVDHLHEPSKKINVVDRLSRHLSKGIPKDALRSYLALVRKCCPKHPVIHIDDSDVVKPDGFVMVLKALQQKMFIKKGIMLRKPLSLPMAAIQSASSLKSIPLKKRISHQPIQSLFLPWNVLPLCLEKQPLSWTVVMMIIRCS